MDVMVNPLLDMVILPWRALHSLRTLPYHGFGHLIALLLREDIFNIHDPISDRGCNGRSEGIQELEIGFAFPDSWSYDFILRVRRAWVSCVVGSHSVVTSTKSVLSRIFQLSVWMLQPLHSHRHFFGLDLPPSRLASV